MSDPASGEFFENSVRRKIAKFHDFRIRDLTWLSGVLPLPANGTYPCTRSRLTAWTATFYSVKFDHESQYTAVCIIPWTTQFFNILSFVFLQSRRHLSVKPWLSYLLCLVVGTSTCCVERKCRCSRNYANRCNKTNFKWSDFAATLVTAKLNQVGHPRMCAVAGRRCLSDYLIWVRIICTYVYVLQD